MEAKSTWKSRRGGRVLVAALIGVVAMACGGAEPATTDETTNDASPAQTGEQVATEDAANPFEGETVELVVPYDPGGGYDTNARMVAPYLQEYLGATVIVTNEPGAGSLLATNLTSQAEPDGLRLQLFNTTGAIAAQIAGAEGVEFDMLEFSWIGRVAAEPSTIVVAADSEFDSFEDILAADRPVRFAATGPGSNEYIGAEFIRQAFDVPVEIITGFEGSGEARAAVLRGEVDARIGTLDADLPGIEAGDLQSILSFSEEPPEQLPDTPALLQLDLDEDQRQLAEALVAMLDTGRSLGGPPGMPEERLSYVRDAFEEAMTDPELIAEAEAQDRPLSYLSGEDLQEMIASVFDSPDAFQQLIESSY